MSKIYPIYWGLFLDEQFDSHLKKAIENQHVTFGFKNECPYHLIGRKYDILIVGYGINKDNEAFIVKIPDELKTVYTGCEPKHVTVSVSISGRPVDSKSIEYHMFSEPFKVSCTMGYFDGTTVVKNQYYIAYGTDCYNPNSFKPIHNRLYFPKPNGGMWASPIFTDYGWKEWCESNDFRTETLDKHFIFSINPYAKILRIQNNEDLKSLTNNHLLQPKHNVFDDDLYCIDYEKLMWLGYDAVEVWINTSDIYFGLYGWDCDSIVVLNPDCIMVQ